ncbi:MarR family transcriptional regulator [Streptomyces sp. NPDC047082]|uniref:MarR family winged helix-turn-helix transcriptional regulator n=1 Tax=Streptomyces sp. NPDC047082 TaxID=3155259 RepID=UPI0033D864FE
MNEQEIASDLRAVVGNLVRRARTTDAMPQAQAAVLGFLDRDGPMTTSELAARQQVRHQSAARVVGQLVELGLARQEPHPDDRRKILVILTDPGLQALQTRRGHRADWLAEAIKAELTPAEQQQLAESVTLLKRLAQHGNRS